MSKSPYTFEKNLTQFERVKQERRLQVLRSNRDFLEQLQKIRNRVASGMDLDQIRNELNLWKGNRWGDLMLCLQKSTNPEAMFMEWSIKARDRYALANRTLINAKNIADEMDRGKAELAAIMVMQKVDEHQMYLYERLGLINAKPLPGQPIEDASGIPSEDIQAAEDKLRKDVEHDIRDQLRLEAEACAPIPIALLEAPQARGEQDLLEQTPVDAVAAGGSK